jgi:hypothetical protein
MTTLAKNIESSFISPGRFNGPSGSQRSVCLKHLAALPLAFEGGTRKFQEVFDQRPIEQEDRYGKGRRPDRYKNRKP